MPNFVRLIGAWIFACLAVVGVGIGLTFMPSFKPITSDLALMVSMGDTVPVERLVWVLDLASSGQITAAWCAWVAFVHGPMRTFFVAIGGVFIVAATAINKLPAYAGLSLAPALFNCIKVAITFIVLMLTRVTVPRYKLETISKLGWLHVIIWPSLIILLCILILSFFV